MSLRLVFMGTPDFSIPTLEALIAARHDVVAVYSQPPRRAGRGMAAKKTPVHLCADRNKIAARTPKSLKSEAEVAEFYSLKADVAVVVAYGLILPEPILTAPRLGCLNLHASKLPRWRGAAPIQRALMAGDGETAVAIMQMETGLDTGPVCLSETVAIDPGTTAGELHDELAKRGAALMVRALEDLEQGRLMPHPQPESGITYAAKIDKSEAQIDFSQPAEDVHNFTRGLSPFPGAWFQAASIGTEQKERLKILRTELVEGQGEPGTVLDDRLTIACGTGAIRLLEIQRAGKRAMNADEFSRGFSLPRGTRLISP
jgi:methionyl-tRNA formyltransferase